MSTWYNAKHVLALYDCISFIETLRREIFCFMQHVQIKFI